MAIDYQRYRGQLLTTEQQLAELRYVDKEKWQGAIGTSVLDAVEVDDKPQDFASVRVLHVEFESLGDTVARWRDLSMKVSSYGLAHWNSMLVRPTDINDCTTLRDRTVRYDPGIHEVTLDLTHDGRDIGTLDDAFKIAEENDIYLAHGEMLSLVGLHRASFLRRGGFAWDTRPYLPGYVLEDLGRPYALKFDTGLREGEMGIRPDPYPSSERIYDSVVMPFTLPLSGA